MDIFTSRQGYVAVMTVQEVVPGKVVIRGVDDNDFLPRAALISGVDYKQSTNQQFQESLDNAIYAYVVGDHMGQVIVRGMAFPAVCDENGGEQTEGLHEILELYRTNRLSQALASVSVVVGTKDKPIEGYMTSLSVVSTAVAEDPKSFASLFEIGISALPADVEVPE